MKLMKVSYSEELLSSGEASSTPYRPRPEQAQSAREGGWLAPVARSRQRLGAERAGLSRAASAERPMGARLRPEQARGPSFGGAARGVEEVVDGAQAQEDQPQP